MDWLGRAGVNFTHSASPLIFEKTDGTKVAFADLCKAATPPCWLNPLLPNGNFQTVWTATQTEAPELFYRRKVFQANHKPYTGSFAVDFVSAPHEDANPTLPPRTAYFTEEQLSNYGSDDTHPMLIVLHGLSGGSHEVYLRHAVGPLVLGEGNWEACVVNSRGCANSQVTSGVLFNGRATWDVRQVVEWARETFPNRPLFGLGFSLGANIITNFAGEEGENCQLKAVVTIGNPFNLFLANKALRRTWAGREIYLKVMGENMKKLVNKHRDAVVKWTNLDLEAIQKVKYLYEFDRVVQCPTWGYPTEEAYYRDASSSDAVLAIRIPYFAISAKDDPIAVDEAVPYEEFKQNPYTVHCSTSLGGHLAWFEFGGGRWFGKPIKALLTSLATDVKFGKMTSVDRPNFPSKTQIVTRYEPMKRKLTILTE